ncbi:glutamate--tRNA ligase [Ectobacillus funiculus]
MQREVAYHCYCTEEELEAEREAQQERGETPHYSGKCRHLTQEQREAFKAEGRIPSIRFAVPKEKSYTFTDMVKGTISFDSNEMGDFVIVKKDGIPTYNYAVVIDDHLMEITHVLRGEEHISNTPKQLMIYEVFGWEAPQFGHMTLIVNENRKKLSKRDESVIQFIQQYADLGYLPEAMFNFICLLGWSPVGEEEIFLRRNNLLKCLIRLVYLNRRLYLIRKKLKWMNNQYMKKQELDRVVELCTPHLIKAGRISEAEVQTDWVRGLVALYHDQLSYGAEIVELSELFFFKDDISYDEEAQAVLNEEQVPEVMQVFFLSQVEAIEDFTPEAVQAAIKAVQKANRSKKGKKLFMPIRVATTGQTHGPDLPKSNLSSW